MNAILSVFVCRSVLKVFVCAFFFFYLTHKKKQKKKRIRKERNSRFFFFFFFFSFILAFHINTNYMITEKEKKTISE